MELQIGVELRVIVHKAWPRFHCRFLKIFIFDIVKKRKKTEEEICLNVPYINYQVLKIKNPSFRKVLELGSHGSSVQHKVRLHPAEKTDLHFNLTENIN